MLNFSRTNSKHTFLHHSHPGVFVDTVQPGKNTSQLGLDLSTVAEVCYSVVADDYLWFGCLHERPPQESVSFGNHVPKIELWGTLLPIEKSSLDLDLLLGRQI